MSMCKQLVQGSRCIRHIIHHTTNIDELRRYAHVVLFLLPSLDGMPPTSLMHMTVQHYRAEFLCFVKHDGIVAQDNKLVAVTDFIIRLDAFPKHTTSTINFIVVPLNQVFMTVKLFHDFDTTTFFAPKSISGLVSKYVNNS